MHLVGFIIRITGTIKYEPRIILSVGDLRVSFTIKLSFFYISLSDGFISFEGPPVFVC